MPAKKKTVKKTAATYTKKITTTDDSVVDIVSATPSTSESITAPVASSDQQQIDHEQLSDEATNNTVSEQVVTDDEAQTTPQESVVIPPGVDVDKVRTMVLEELKKHHTVVDTAEAHHDVKTKKTTPLIQKKQTVLAAPMKPSKENKTVAVAKKSATKNQMVLPPLESPAIVTTEQRTEQKNISTPDTSQKTILPKKTTHEAGMPDEVHAVFKKLKAIATHVKNHSPAKSSMHARTSSITNSSTTTQETVGPAMSMFLINMVTALVLLGGLMVFTIGFGVYTNEIKPDTAEAVTEIIPFPAGIVNQHFLTISEYRSDIAALNRFYAVQVDAGLYGNLPQTDDVHTVVWDRFVEGVLLESIARDYEVVLTSAEIQNELNTVIQQAGSQELLSQQVAYLYGWDIQHFVDKVVQPYLLQEKVAAAVFYDEQLRTKKQQAAQVLATELQQNPDDFATQVRALSQDFTSKESGGSIGRVPRGQLPDEVAVAIELLSPGEVTEVIETGEGYELYQLQSRSVGQNGEPIFEVSRLLLRYPSYEELLQEKKQSARIFRFVR